MQNLNLLTLTCGCLCFLAVSAWAADDSPRLGQPYPDFTLPDITDGKPVSLSQFHGRKVLLINFASW